MTSVLITGASTGIGRATAERLAKTGATVFAGARAQKDLDALRAIGPNVVPVALEVTDATSIAAARAIVEAKVGTRLDALVNNAGIVMAGPWEMLTPEDFRRQMDVNVLGPLMITQAFLPHLRAAKGRIVVTGSIGGRMSTPYIGAYAASKHAIEAFCDALRVEMIPFGIKVVLIEPGAIKTPLWQRTSTASLASASLVDPAIAALYEKPIEKMLKLSARLEAGGAAPDLVAKTIESSLTVKHPKSRYLVGTDAKVQAIIRNLPDGVRDRLMLSLFS